MDFSESASEATLREQVQAFFDAELLPRHRDWAQWVGTHAGPPPWLDALREKARNQGLWNLALADLAPDEPGTRLSNLAFGGIAEIMGRLPWASEVFNCHAPDVPNMITLQHAGTPEQKKRWLQPLLEGKIRSAFAMTEPDVGSSDATNLQFSIRRDGDDYVLNGRKWYCSGASHPRCKFLIVMGATDLTAARNQRHSAVIVPIDAPGLKIVRDLRFMGLLNPTSAASEIVFDDVRVPRANLLGQEGQGFKVAQTRLGPARIHHCMRALGSAEVLIELMMARANERQTFGRALVEYDTVQRWIAESRIEVEQARLLVQRAAWLLDRDGHAGAWRDVSIIKVAVPRMVQGIADRALQVYGAMGGSDDTPIHGIYAHMRAMRIADGPDEVHLRQIFRMENLPAWSVADSPYNTAPRRTTGDMA